MSKVKAFIINFNRLHYPKAMADHLAECDNIEPIIIDNHSTYPPLLEYYKTCPHKIEQMDKNYGNCVMWNSGLIDKYNLQGNFIYTDPDLDLSSVPKDLLHVLQTGLDKYQWADKCGLSLTINDLPDNQISREVHQWEDQNWNNKLDDRYYRAAIDTTLSLFRSRIHSFECLRTAPPYCARHLPWYHTPENLPEDEKYYLESTGTYFNHWTSRFKKG